jgi:hypothetical protein
MKLLRSEPFKWTHWQPVPTIDNSEVERVKNIMGIIWPTETPEQYTLSIHGDVALRLNITKEFIFAASAVTIYYYHIPTISKVYDDSPHAGLILKEVQKMYDEFTAAYNERMSKYPSRAFLEFHPEDVPYEADRIARQYYTDKMNRFKRV